MIKARIYQSPTNHKERVSLLNQKQVLISVLSEVIDTAVVHSDSLITLLKLQGKLHWVHDFQNQLKTRYDNAVLCVEQAIVLMQCCPCQPPGGTECLSPLPASQLSGAATMNQQDPTWQENMNTITVSDFFQNVFRLLIVCFQYISIV